jgi:CheY-like chemotaxis protein
MSILHPPQKLNILLGDDDKDDCQFFKEALEELQLQAKFTTVHDGEQLMQLLAKNSDELLMFFFSTSTCHAKMVLPVCRK